MITNVAEGSLFAQSILKILEDPPERSTTARQSLAPLLTCDAPAFSRAAGVLLVTGMGLPGYEHLIQFLVRQKMLVETLVDAEGYHEDKAIAVVKETARLGSPLDAGLEQALTAALQKPPSAANALRVLRLMDLLAAVASPSRFLLFQHELMACPDSRVRSRAALLTARINKNTSWIGRLLRDDDARVQANAVEALWEFDAAAAKPLLRAASRSRHNRVAGNALVGLYGISELGAIRMMFEMAEHKEARFRATALWAMGETADSRFVPYLSEQVQRRTGAERLAVLKAMTRIRKHEKVLQEAGAVEIRVSRASLEPDGTRRLVVTLRAPGGPDLSSLKPTQFALWEGPALINDYTAAGSSNPALLIAGLIVPRFTSTEDPYGIAVGQAINRCMQLKRPDDMWRIDRYNPGESAPPSTAPVEAANLPYDDALLVQQVKTQRGFLSTAEMLGKAISSQGPRERTAPSLDAAIERVGEAICKLSGTRHIFLFCPTDNANEVEQSRIDQLIAIARNERIVLHGIALVPATGDSAYRRLCLAVEGGTFNVSSVEAISDTLDDVYSQLLNKYEISYRVPPEGGEPKGGTLLVSSGHGSGRVTYSLTKPPAETIPAPSVASAATEESAA